MEYLTFRDDAGGGRPATPAAGTTPPTATDTEAARVLARVKRMGAVAMALLAVLAMVGALISPSSLSNAVRPATALDAHDDDFDYYAPGTMAPSFTVTTLNGSDFKFNHNEDFGDVVPTMVLTVDIDDTWWQWILSSDKSLLHFATGTPVGVTVVFVPKNDKAVDDIRGLRARMVRAMEDAGATAAAIGERMDKFYFSQQTLEELDDEGSNLPVLVNQKPWRSEVVTVSLKLSSTDEDATQSSSSLLRGMHLAASPFAGSAVQLGRLDCQGACCTGEPQQGVTHTGVVDLGDACALDAPAAAAQGKVLLASVGAGCTYEDAADALVATAEEVGATAGLLIARGVDGAAQAAKAGVVEAKEADFESLRPVVRNAATCRGATSEGVPVSTLSAADGESLRQALQAHADAGLSAADVEMAFVSEYGVGYFVGIDSRGLLYQAGWRFYGEMDLEFVSSETRYLDYLSSYYEAVDRPALVVPIFESAPMDDVTYDVGSDVMMPKASLLQEFSSMSIDFELSCDGTLDNECDKWDHVITMQVSCDGMDETIEFASDAAEEGRRLTEVGGDWNEIGRWVTPFRRSVGKWVTDASPMAPMVYYDSCHFTAKVTSGSWTVSASLRFEQGTEKETLKAQSIVPLVYDDATEDFDSLASYNANRTLTFDTPKGTKKVLLHALISGHGDCEFMPTSHHWKINTHVEFEKGFLEAGTMWGCADKVADGAEPNQHGTYFYGRDGWCDGSPVAPVVFDVTDAVDLTEGASNTIVYRGVSYAADDDQRWADSLLHIYDKPKTTTDGCDGYILLSSSLTFYA